MAFENFTIIDVARALNVAFTKHLSWSVGLAVRQHFEKKYGRIPPHQLRTKTCGVGVHCFVVYPEWYWPEVEQFWLARAAPRPPGSLDLFLFP